VKAALGQRLELDRDASRAILRLRSLGGLRAPAVSRVRCSSSQSARTKCAGHSRVDANAPANRIRKKCRRNDDFPATLVELDFATSDHHTEL